MVMPKTRRRCFLLLSFLLCFMLIATQGAGRNLRSASGELEGAKKHTGNHQSVVVITKKKSTIDIDIDINNEDYTPAQKKPPIHN
nr:hypothetical protein CR513_08402 [Ipomoea trifida]